MTMLVSGADAGLLGDATAIWRAESYWLVRFLLQRGLAVVYLLGFLVAARQFRPLAGEGGLLPIEEYLERSQFRDRPSLFYLFPDDDVIGYAAWTGVLLSALAVVGIPSLLGPVVSVTVWATLWGLYLSFVNAGQTFYGFGWESMLLEAGFLAIFLGAFSHATPVVIVWLFRWLLFRNMLGAGLIKLRGDDCWRDLSCMEYHYETQPMPNPASWYAHHLPRPLHRFAVLVNHIVEIAVPFLYFAPQPIASVAGLVTIGFMAWLMITGNFSWLNFLTMVLAVSTLSDSVLTAVFPASVSTPAVTPVPVPLLVAVLGVTATVLALSYFPVRNMLSDRQVMNTAFDPLHIVNSYGAFGSITRNRFELVVQGTDNETIDESTAWQTYTFPGKPTDPERRPPQVAPYHLRLDWQLWFAAMTSSPARHPWVYNLLAKLLAGSEETKSLLRTDPFPDGSPSHVRILRYRYEFTDPAARAKTGQWWTRERIGTYVDPVSLEDPQFRAVLGRYGWEQPQEQEQELELE